MKDQVTFSNKKYQDKFNKTRDIYFDRIEEIMREHDEEVEYILDPVNKMARSNLDFQRSITIDHIVMEILAIQKEGEKS